MTIPIHPAADLVPPLEAASYAALKADIRSHGQQRPIAAWQGRILDGRSRMRACIELGLPPIVEELASLPGDSPTLYVLSANLRGTRLSQRQLAMIGPRVCLLLEAERKQTPHARSVPLDSVTPLAIAARTVAMRRLELSLELRTRCHRQVIPEVRVWADTNASGALSSESELNLRLRRPWRWCAAIAIEDRAGASFFYRLGLRAAPGTEWSLRIYDAVLGRDVLLDGDALAAPKTWPLGSCCIAAVEEDGPARSAAEVIALAQYRRRSPA